MTREQRDRRVRALALRRAGKTWRYIGETLGVSRERARQLAIAGLCQERKRLGAEEPPWPMRYRIEMVTSTKHTPKGEAAVR